MYQKDADGIYIFNHFYTDKDMGAHTYYIDEAGNKTCKNVIRDKMIVASSQKLAENGMRVYVNTCSEYYNKLYPINVVKDNPCSFSINTGSRPQNGCFNVVVGIDVNDGDSANPLKVSVNGSTTTQLQDILPEPGFEWKINDFFEPTATICYPRSRGKKRFPTI